MMCFHLPRPEKHPPCCSMSECVCLCVWQNESVFASQRAQTWFSFRGLWVMNQTKHQNQTPNTNKGSKHWRIQPPPPQLAHRFPREETRSEPSSPCNHFMNEFRLKAWAVYWFIQSRAGVFPLRHKSMWWMNWGNMTDNRVLYGNPMQCNTK